MKKALSIILILIFILALTVLPFGAALAEDDPSHFNCYQYLIKLEQDFPQRAAGSDGESACADYLVEVLSSAAFGYNVEKKKFSFVTTDEYGGSINEKSYNVIAKKDCPTSDKKVVIGAYYDNVYSASSDKGTGAYANASGVAALLSTAFLLKNADIPFDLEFVLFGASSVGDYGVKEYVDKMTQKDIDSTLLFIDFECVSGGDDIYVYCEETDSVTERLLLENALEETGLKAAPSNKKIYGAQAGASAYPYSHIGLETDQTYFREKGIPTALFISNDWDDTTYFGVSESSSHNDVWNTQNDNLENMIDYYGNDFYKRIDCVAWCVAGALKSNDFTATMTQAKAELKDYSFFGSKYVVYIGYGVVGLIIVALIALMIYFKKHDTYIEREKPQTPPTDGGAFDDTQKEESKKVFEDF